MYIFENDDHSHDKNHYQVIELDEFTAMVKEYYD